MRQDVQPGSLRLEEQPAAGRRAQEASDTLGLAEPAIDRAPLRGHNHRDVGLL